MPGKQLGERDSNSNQLDNTVTLPKHEGLQVLTVSY